jgi:hypothetical protein
VEVLKEKWHVPVPDPESSVLPVLPPVADGTDERLAQESVKRKVAGNVNHALSTIAREEVAGHLSEQRP